MISIPSQYSLQRVWSVLRHLASSSTINTFSIGIQKCSEKSDKNRKKVIKKKEAAKVYGRLPFHFFIQYIFIRRISR